MSLEQKFVPCANYVPDQPDYDNGGSAMVQNVVPRTKTTFAPMPSFVAHATASLNSRPLGAFSAIDSSGNGANYTGTATKLYALTAASKPNFVDRTRSSGGAYSVPLDNLWSFAEAAGFIYATNGTDPVQTVQTATTNNFANVTDTNTPTARFAAFIQPGFLLLGNINDPTVGIRPQGIRWSSLGDATSFPLVGGLTAIANSSDWQNIIGPHGRMMGFAPNLSACNCAIFFEGAIFKMLFTGTETIFAIQPVEEARGTTSPASICTVGQVSFFLAPNGYFAFDGTEAVPIGEGQVNATFFKDADPNYLDQVSATTDPVTGLIFWSYAGVGNVGGVPNRVLVYHPYIQRWAFITDQAGESMFQGRTTGTSLDGIDALGYTLDDLPYSLDSSFLSGGNFVIAGFTNTFNHGSFTGPNMEFVVDTSEVQLIEGRNARVNAVRPIVEGDVTSAAVGGRVTLSKSPVFSAPSAPDQYGRCMARNESRYHRFRLTRAAGNLVTHIQGAEAEFSPGAKR